jgi:hypothetical protein
MIDKRKLARDIAIVLVVAAAVFLLLRSRQPGPVEQLSAQSPHGDTTQMPADHGQMPPDINAGDPVASIGGRTLGRDWVDDTAARFSDYLVGQEQMDAESASNLAQEEALIEGLVKLIEAQTYEEWNIQPDAEVMAQQEQSFASSPDAQQIMEQMGLTKERLEALWRSENQGKQLRQRIAEMDGAEPDSPEADAAYVRWLNEKLAQAQIEFIDPAMQPLYQDYLQSVKDAESIQESISGGEGDIVVDDTSTGGSTGN